MNTNTRLYGLDVARSVLLIGGPVFHSELVIYSTPLLTTITITSHLFRMAAFFAIAGYLVALNPAASHWSWLKIRARQLVIPLISLSVITTSLLLWVRPYDIDPSFNIDNYPFHLWFLVSLCLMSPMSVILRGANLGTKTMQFFERYPAAILIAAVTMSCGVRIYAWCVLHIAMLLSKDISFLDLTILVETPKFLIYYLLGFTLASRPRIAKALDNNGIIAIGFVSLVLTVALLTNFRDETGVNHHYSWLKIFSILMQELTQAAMSLSIILLALRVKRAHPSWLWFSKSSYAIYLFHFPIIIIVAYFVKTSHPSLNSYAGYTVLLTTSLLGSYLIYAVIARSRFLLFLFNGARWPRAVPVPA